MMTSREVEPVDDDKELIAELVDLIADLEDREETYKAGFVRQAVTLIERLTLTWSSEKPTKTGDHLLQRPDGSVFAWTFTKGDFHPGMAADGFVSRGVRFAGPIIVQEPPS